MEKPVERGAIGHLEKDSLNPEGTQTSKTNKRAIRLSLLSKTISAYLAKLSHKIIFPYLNSYT